MEGKCAPEGRRRGIQAAKAEQSAAQAGISIRSAFVYLQSLPKSFCRFRELFGL